jgi:hypothetical protein
MNHQLVGAATGSSFEEALRFFDLGKFGRALKPPRAGTSNSLAT